MTRRGFTIVELIITITIMGILLTLAVVNVNSTQLKARDDKRTTSVEAIGNYLDSYYSNGAPVGTTTTTNLASNPSFETGFVNINASNISLNQSNVWASDGTYSATLLPNAASNDSFINLGGDTGGMRLGMVAGKTYTLSAILRIPATLTGTLYAGRAGCITAWWYTTSVPSYVRKSSCADTTTGTYPLSVTFTLPSDTTQSFIRLYNGGSTGSSTVYYDSVMVTETDARPDFADGDKDGWSWNGTANESSSKGPLVIGGAPGVYPSIAVTSSLLTQYLPDADTKAFIAPGQTDASASFIPATNAVQATTGVLPQPGINQYVYQPIDAAGGLCTDNTCRKYNIYYKLESDNAVHMVSSKNQ